MKVATEKVECDNDDMAKFGVVGLGARSAKAVMAAWLNLNMASQVLKLSLSSPPSYSSLSRLNPLLKNDDHHYRLFLICIEDK